MNEREKSTYLEQTAFALGKLYSATENHPYTEAWRVRSTLPAVISWARADGENADSVRVWADVSGTPYRPLKDQGWDKRAVRAVSYILDVETDYVLDEDVREVEKARSYLKYSRGRSLLDSALLGYRRWSRHAGYGFSGRLAYAEALNRAGLAARVFPALAPRRTCFNNYGEVDEALIRLGAYEAAELAWNDWQSFVRMLDGAADRLSARRKSSRQRAALLALAASPVLTPRVLSEKTSMSVEGASLILEEFVRLGVAEEITKRKWGRQFTFRDSQGTELLYEARASNK